MSCRYIQLGPGCHGHDSVNADSPWDISSSVASLASVSTTATHTKSVNVNAVKSVCMTTKAQTSPQSRLTSSTQEDSVCGPGGAEEKEDRDEGEAEEVEGREARVGRRGEVGGGAPPRRNHAQKVETAF